MKCSRFVVEWMCFPTEESSEWRVTRLWVFDKRSRLSSLAIVPELLVHLKSKLTYHFREPWWLFRKFGDIWNGGWFMSPGAMAIVPEPRYTEDPAPGRRWRIGLSRHRCRANARIPLRSYMISMSRIWGVTIVWADWAWLEKVLSIEIWKLRREDEMTQGPVTSGYLLETVVLCNF